jgi:hypothetical protein
MTSRIRTLINHYPNAASLLGSCLIGGMVIYLWVIESWEYLPEWAPVPGPALMNLVSCLRPIPLFICGIPTAIVFLGGLISNFRSFTNHVPVRNVTGLMSFILSLAILGSSILLLIYKDKLEKDLKQYGISRYDVVINAIEKYHADMGHYPPTLEALVPAYLASVPGKYMKFGEELNYYPDPSSESARGYIGSGPFIFELTGKYAGMHGQTLKYCPIQDETCKAFKGRIDDRWIWTYSSIL